MSDGEKVPNISYLGTCYDVVTMDPLNLGSSSKLQHVIDLEAPGAYLTPDGRFSVPNGVRHEAPLSMSYESQSSVISSAYELQQELKRSVDVEAGVEGAFEFSGSASVKEVEREAGTRKNSFVYSRAYQEDHRVALDLSDDKTPIKVTQQFRDAVDQLSGLVAKTQKHVVEFGKSLNYLPNDTKIEVLFEGVDLPTMKKGRLKSDNAKRKDDYAFYILEHSGARANDYALLPADRRTAEGWAATLYPVLKAYLP